MAHHHRFPRLIRSQSLDWMGRGVGDLGLGHVNGRADRDQDHVSALLVSAVEIAVVTDLEVDHAIASDTKYQIYRFLRHPPVTKRSTF